MIKLLKILPIVLVLMILTTACAVNNDFNETTTFLNFTDSNKDYTITKGGTYEISGTLKNAKLKVKAKNDVTLILSGVEFENTVDEAISIESQGITTIKATEKTKNTISGGGDAAIKAESEIVFAGNGIIEINGTEKHAIECESNITVKSGTLKINSYEHGMKSEAIITILSGNIEIYAETGKGIKAEKEFLAQDGNVKIIAAEDEGLESKGALTINGGSFDIIAGEDGINAGTSDKTKEENGENAQFDFKEMPPMGEMPEMPEVERGEFPKNKMPEGEFSDRGVPGRGPGGPGGRFERPEGGFERPEGNDKRPEGDFRKPEGEFVVPEGATSSGSGVPFSHENPKGFGGGMRGPSVNPDSVLTINGGTVKITCAGDGIDSNGSLSINGGTVIIDGPASRDNGSLDSDGDMIIDGATVLTASAKGMVQLPRTMNQPMINVSFESALEKDTEIIIMDSENNIVVEHNVGVICEALFFTSPMLKDDITYKVYINGEEHSDVTAGYSSNGFPGGFGAGFGRGPMGGK